MKYKRLIVFLSMIFVLCFSSFVLALGDVTSSHAGLVDGSLDTFVTTTDSRIDFPSNKYSAVGIWSQEALSGRDNFTVDVLDSSNQVIKTVPTFTSSNKVQLAFGIPPEATHIHIWANYSIRIYEVTLDGSVSSSPSSGSSDSSGTGLLMPVSNSVPKIDYHPPIQELFRNFYVNWHTLAPALWVLYGTLFAFFMLKIAKRFYGD